MSGWNPGWEDLGKWVDSLPPTAYPPGYDGPLDERTPGIINISALRRLLIERDRERLLDEARD